MKITQLSRYPRHLFQFVPLYHWQHTTARTNKKTGIDKIYQDGKRPIHGNWTKRTYNNEQVFERAKQDKGNVGIRLTAEQCVVDVDTRNDGDKGLEQVLSSLSLHDEFARAPMVRTGGGGMHYYFRKPPYAVVDTIKDVPGVEFKSLGRQVVAAGSKHPNGKHYVWDDSEGRKSITDDDLPMIPASLFKMIRKVQKQQATEGGNYDQAQIQKILDKLDPQEFNNNDTWLELMMSIHHASAGSARYEFTEWSTRDPNYADDAEIIGRRWDSLDKEKGDGVTYRTLNHILRQRNLHELQAAPNVPDDEFADELDPQHHLPNDDHVDFSNDDTSLSFELPPSMPWNRDDLPKMLDYAQDVLIDSNIDIYQMGERRLVTIRRLGEFDSLDENNLWRPSRAATVQDLSDHRLLEAIIEKVSFTKSDGRRTGNGRNTRPRSPLHVICAIDLTSGRSLSLRA